MENPKISHSQILEELLKKIQPIDFELKAFPRLTKLKIELKSLDIDSTEYKSLEAEIKRCKLKETHFIVYSIENILEIARQNNWGICKNQSFIYVYNGEYWCNLDKETIKKFLGESAEKLGVTEVSSRYFDFREKLYKQFLTTGYLPTPDPDPDSVLINLKNGTFEINSNGNRLRGFDPKDFLTYQLPFSFDMGAKCPIWNKFLSEMLPEMEKQKVLSEFLGYVFIKNGQNSLKLEKALILHGSGANGKSVVFEVVNALLGKENTSTYSLQSLTDHSGYSRAMIANKLVNYASEINGKLEVSVFKQLASGEPVEARLPFCNPMIIDQYAKMIFNTNELPKEVENTDAFFRRFLIIPFEKTIPEIQQDKELHKKIIEMELSGVFIWVLDGLERLLKDKKFTPCDSSDKAIKEYKLQSDSVSLFIAEEGYVKSTYESQNLKDIYSEYKTFCLDGNYRPVNISNFKKRLEKQGFEARRLSLGNVLYLKRAS